MSYFLSIVDYHHKLFMESRKERLKKKRNSNIPKERKILTFFFRFFLWLFSTIIILLASALIFIHLILNGPSPHAKYEFLTRCRNNELISFIPTLFYSPNEIDMLIEKYEREEVRHE